MIILLSIFNNNHITNYQIKIKQSSTRRGTVIEQFPKIPQKSLIV